MEVRLLKIKKKIFGQYVDAAGLDQSFRRQKIRRADYASNSLERSSFKISALVFIIARSWKQPRCPSADEWIRKLWYIYTMEYYSAIKRIHLHLF